MKVADLFEAEDADLMVEVARSLFKKGELHLYYRQNKKVKNPSWYGKVTKFTVEPRNGREHLHLETEREAVKSERFGYDVERLALQGQLTKIEGRHALLMTGKFA
jgi:hypothetical protein